MGEGKCRIMYRRESETVTEIVHFPQKEDTKKLCKFDCNDLKYFMYTRCKFILISD